MYKDDTRARKRPRFDSDNNSHISVSTNTSFTSQRSMRPPESDQSSTVSFSLTPPLLDDEDEEAGLGGGGLAAANGHTNGLAPPSLNGTSLLSLPSSSSSSMTFGNGVQKHTRAIARITLPGTTLYPDSIIDREEFVRLVLQSLRDVGYKYVACFFPYWLPFSLTK
jgi:hypothetical protein